jgi:hypothetical protein
MQYTNQRVMVFDLEEVELEDFNLPSGLQAYEYSGEGEQFVVNYPSNLAYNLIQLAQQEEIVDLDTDEFIKRKEFKNGSYVNINYHNNVKLL